MEVYQKFEKFFRANKVSPSDRFKYKDYDVFVFEGGPYPLTDKDKKELDWMNDFPEGMVYEAGFGVALGNTAKFAMAWPVRYFHNIKDTSHGRRQARIEAAKDEARKAIDRFDEATDARNRN